MTRAEIVQYLKDRAPLSPADVTCISSRLVGDVTGTIHRMIRAFVPRTAEDILDEWFPWTRDQRLAMDSNIAEDERMAALHRIASAVPWNPYSHWNGGDHRGPQELHARAAAEGRSTKQVIDEILEEAVLLVLGDWERVRRIHVGSGAGSFSLRETDGANTMVSPAELPYSANSQRTGSTSNKFNESPYLYWFDREVQKAATAILLDDPYPPADTTSDLWTLERSHIDMDQMHDEQFGRDPLLQLLESEHYSEHAHKLLQVLQQSSPQQREILLHLADGRSVAEAARELGIAESTARVQFKRIRDKAAKM